MKGIIYNINLKRGMVAVLTEQNDFSTFEILENDNFKKGDFVCWKKDKVLGLGMIKNITKKVTVKVYFQNHLVNKDQLRKQLLY